MLCQQDMLQAVLILLAKSGNSMFKSVEPAQDIITEMEINYKVLTEVKQKVILKL